MRRFIVLFFALLVACGTPDTIARPTAMPVVPATPVATADPCAPEALQAYRIAYNTITDRWSAALIEAGQASIQDLKIPIDQLQQIHDALAALTPPECARHAHDVTMQAMKQTIEGYRNIMAQKDAGQMIRTGIDMIAGARDQVNALPGTPVPTATPAPTNTPLPTYTPLPTATPTATPSATPTPAPRPGVISSRQAQLFDSPTSTTPIKTLLRGTEVLVFELQRGRLHVRAGDSEGWVSQGAVQLR